MKITWASHSSSLGGAELCLVEATRGLVSSGHELHVLLPSEGDLRVRLEDAGASVSVVRYLAWMHTGRLTRPIYYQARRLPEHVRSVVDISRLLAKQRPDVVVTNTITVAAPAVAAWRLGIPHAWYIHEFGWEDHGAVYDFGSRISYAAMRGSSAQFILNSEAVRDKYRWHFPLEHLHVVRYAVELDHAENPRRTDDGVFRMALVGQLAPAKRQEDAVRAVALLKERGCHAYLTLVGGEKPPHGSAIRKLIMELKVDQYISMTGFVNDPVPYLDRSDLALMCSRSEAFGRVTIEAMKLGKPVIGARSGATTELIRDGWNGLLYRPGDALDLANKLASLYHDRSRLLEMGQNARLWSTDTFTMERYVNGLLNVFTQASHRPRTAHTQSALNEKKSPAPET